MRPPVTSAMLVNMRAVHQRGTLEGVSPAMSRRLRPYVRRTRTCWVLTPEGEKLITPLPPSGWVKIPPPPPPPELPCCDICGKKAVWEHPMGGLRCGTCPRPEK